MVWHRQELPPEPGLSLVAFLQRTGSMFLRSGGGFSKDNEHKMSRAPSNCASRGQNNNQDSWSRSSEEGRRPRSFGSFAQFGDIFPKVILLILLSPSSAVNWQDLQR